MCNSFYSYNVSEMDRINLLKYIFINCCMYDSCGRNNCFNIIIYLNKQGYRYENFINDLIRLF
jgi:hypothetical protein